MRLGFPDAKNQTSGANPSKAYISDLSILITSLIWASILSWLVHAASSPQGRNTGL